MRKTKSEYVNYLNGIYSGSDLLENGNFEYLIKTNSDKGLAAQGLYGNLLKKNDPIAFNVGFSEWQPR